MHLKKCAYLKAQGQKPRRPTSSQGLVAALEYDVGFYNYSLNIPIGSPKSINVIIQCLP